MGNSDNGNSNYIPVSVMLFTHPKTKRAARLAGLSVDGVVISLMKLWIWAFNHSRDGKVTIREDILEDEMGWEGKQGVLIAALLNCAVDDEGTGFLERRGDGLYIHDWHDYGGKLFVKREYNAKRQAQHRESKQVAADLAGKAGGTPLVHASGEMADAWREAVGVEPTPGLVRSMQAAEKTYGLEEVLAAIEITGEAGKATWGYTAGVLKNRANGTGPNGEAEEDPDLAGIDWSQFTKPVTFEERFAVLEFEGKEQAMEMIRAINATATA